MTIEKVHRERAPGAHALPSRALMVLVVLAWAWVPEGIMAQASAAATAPQMRHFWHVFAAYAVAWILLFGWVLSIFRRLGRVEGKLD